MGRNIEHTPKQPPQKRRAHIMSSKAHVREITTLLLLLLAGGCFSEEGSSLLMINPCHHRLDLHLTYEDASAVVGATNSVQEIIQIPPGETSRHPLPPLTDFGVHISIGGPPDGTHDGFRLSKLSVDEIGGTSVLPTSIPKRMCQQRRTQEPR